MLYQTLVGCWPPDLQPDDEAGVKELAERVAQWQLKALREAKLQTNWLAPDEAYEAGCRDFLFDILAPQRRDGFLKELAAFVARIGRAGALNSLQQTVLRLASPGIPDLYQGTELWDFSLVDPDNRRPVDFAKREAWLVQTPPSEFLSSWHDGRVKLAVVQRVLALREHLPELLSQSTYLPLTVRGTHASSVIAFARRHGNAWAVVVASRLAAGLLGEDGEAAAGGCREVGGHCRGDADRSVVAGFVRLAQSRRAEGRRKRPAVFARCAGGHADCGAGGGWRAAQLRVHAGCRRGGP